MAPEKEEGREAMNAPSLDRKKEAPELDRKEVDERKEVAHSKEKVNNTELMMKLRERMKIAEKQAEDRKKRKSRTQVRKEEDRRKEDKKQAAGSKNVKEMMKLWNQGGAVENLQRTGIPPNNLDIGRKHQGTSQEGILTGSEEAPTRSTQERSSEGKEDRKHQEQASGSRENSTGTGTICKIIVRKSWQDSKERKEGSNADQAGKPSKEAVKPCPRNTGRKPGTLRSKEQRPKITDLIKNFNSLDKAARNSEELALDREKELTLVEKHTDSKKRKLMVEDEVFLPDRKDEKRSKLSVLRSESERDKNIYRHFKFKNHLFSEEPATGWEGGKDRGSLGSGVGEVLGAKAERSPISPAGIGNARLYSRYTASLLGEENRERGK